MATLRRIRSGRLAKANGALFENRLKACASSQGFKVLHLPLGAKQIGANKLIRVQTPFDFVFVKKGDVIFADAKSTSGMTFTASQITHHQVRDLLDLELHGQIAGYIVYFSTLNEVVFFRSLQLMNLKPRSSLKPSDGILLGDRTTLNVQKIIEVSLGKVPPSENPLKPQQSPRTQD